MRPVRLFPTLYDISPCINREHPEYHPSSATYKKYWEEQEKRCLEGLWFEDTDGVRGGWRYMPGNLYFYVNFCIIEDEDETGNTVAIIHPKLRDVEWMMIYGWISARGFSGFEDDAEFTSHRIVKKIETKQELTPKEHKLLGTLKGIHKPDGNLKKYVEARDYLYKTHFKPLGRPLYENEALNFFCLGSRGWGKSFMLANAIISHEYNFFGKKYFNDKYLINPAPVEIFVGSAIAAKSSDLLKKFNKTQERLKKEYGSWGKNDDFIPGFFYRNSVGSLLPNASSPFRHEYKYKESGVWLDGGTGTRILHGVYTTENPQAAVGTRPTVMAIEEVGLLGNLLDVQASNETCQIRRTKFGSSIYIGTAGNMEKIVESQIVFEDPISYNFLPYEDHWENRSGPIGFFIPAYYVDNSFKDKNGNTDLDSAFAEEVHQRKVREKAANSSALDGYMMARPLVPSEMFLSPTANVFPTAKLRQREAELETKKIFQSLASIGDLVWTDSTQRDVKWAEDISPKRLSKPITKLNLDSYKNDYTSSIVIYEHPSEGIPQPTFMKSLYKVVYDPVRDDGYGTSLASIIVYKGYTDKDWNMGCQNDIVAEWIGRYDQVSDIHDLCLKMAYYYNAMILVENNLPGFITYCKSNKHVHKLMMNPHEAISKAVKSGGSGKYQWGVTMNKQLSIHSEQLIRQWLLEPWQTLEGGKVLLNLDKIKSPRLLKELIAYDRDRNFDHVSSLKLLALWLSNEKEGVKYSEQTSTKSKYHELDKFIKTLKVDRARANPWFLS